MIAGDVQVQRAGGQGFEHNEVNPDDGPNRMIQLWVQPEREGDCAGYKVYQPGPGSVTRIYGGATDQDRTFDSHTVIEIARLNAGQQLSLERPTMVYITAGRGSVDGHALADGDLLRGSQQTLVAAEDAILIVVTTTH